MSKKININPEFFKLRGRSVIKKKKIKPIINAKALKPNDVKKKLIAKIKEHQKREKDKLLEEKKKEEDKFKNEFTETLSYLEGIKKKRKKKRTFKNKKNIQNPSPIISSSVSTPSSVSTSSFSSLPQPPTNLPPPSLPLPPPPYSSVKSTSYTSQKKKSLESNNINIVSEKMTDPPYGCLKGGSKPTFREWKNKTLKNRNTESNIPIHINKSFDDNHELRVPKNVGFSERQKKLLDLQHKFQEEKKPKKIKTRRIKRKITLGKQGKIIGVLVKSKKTRKNIKNEVTILKKKDIQEVKNYLRKHNLVKIGSNAPNDIFRSIYENAYLSGDVRNKNPDILLHNWHKENKI